MALPFSTSYPRPDERMTAPASRRAAPEVDGQNVATLKIAHTIAFLLPADETFDVGSNTSTPVNDKDYQVPFRFNGKINKLTFNLGPVQLAEQEHQKLEEAVARARD